VMAWILPALDTGLPWSYIWGWWWCPSVLIEPKAFQWGPKPQPWRTLSRQHPCIASQPLCHSRESTPPHLCLHCWHRGPPAATVPPPQQVHVELLGSQVPPARSKKAPPPEMHVVVHHAMPPVAVARLEVPADQWVDNRCSCVRCGEDEPFII
jgi:hypothetical protein